MTQPENPSGHTVGPWFVIEAPVIAVTASEGHPVIAELTDVDDRRDCLAEIIANARLIAAAPDHALIGWAMCVADGRWEAWGDGRGEFCINGMRYATKLDEFGIPEVTAALRAAIDRAKGDGK